MYELERAERAEKSAGTRWKKRWNALKKALERAEKSAGTR